MDEPKDIPKTKKDKEKLWYPGKKIFIPLESWTTTYTDSYVKSSTDYPKKINQYSVIGIYQHKTKPYVRCDSFDLMFGVDDDWIKEYGSTTVLPQDREILTSDLYEKHELNHIEEESKNDKKQKKKKETKKKDEPKKKVAKKVVAKPVEKKQKKALEKAPSNADETDKENDNEPQDKTEGSPTSSEVVITAQPSTTKKRGRPKKLSPPPSSSSSAAAAVEEEEADELVDDDVLVPTKSKKVKNAATSKKNDCIYIYCNDERPLEFNVDVSTTTVEDFEQMISEKTQIPVSDFFIEDPHNKKPMEESERFLTYYNVMIGDTLYLKIVNKNLTIDSDDVLTTNL